MARTTDNDTVEGKFLDLVAAYFVGDPDAVAVIDTAVEVAGTLAWAHSGPHVHDYHELRHECDLALDELLEPLAAVERHGWLEQANPA